MKDLLSESVSDLKLSLVADFGILTSFRAITPITPKVGTMAELPTATGKMLEEALKSTESADLPGATSDYGPAVKSSEHDEAYNAGQNARTQSQSSFKVVSPVTVTVEKPSVTSDPLQVAAQLYPWMHMTSTLEACFQDAEKSAQTDLKERADALEAEEADIKDQRVRFEAEKLTELYDELSLDKFAHHAPTIMQNFLSHGDACTELEAEALEVASQDLDKVTLESSEPPTWAYNELLVKLENLQTQASELESSILRLIAAAGLNTEHESERTTSSLSAAQTSDAALHDLGESAAARSQIAPLFSACLPIVRARTANISMALQLVEGAKENLAMMLHLESLGIDDDGEGDGEQEAENEDYGHEEDGDGPEENHADRAGHEDDFEEDREGKIFERN